LACALALYILFLERIRDMPLRRETTERNDNPFRTPICIFKFLPILLIIFLTTTLCKREHPQYRLIDHLKTDNVIDSPFLDIKQRFSTKEEKWAGDQMPLIEIRQRNPVQVGGGYALKQYHGYSSRSLMFFDDMNTLTRDGNHIDFLSGGFFPRYSYQMPFWSIIQDMEIGSADIRKKYPEMKFENGIKLPANGSFLSEPLAFPDGIVSIKVFCSSISPESSHSSLRVSLNNEEVGKAYIGELRWYKFCKKVRMGSFKLRLAVDSSKDSSTQRDEGLYIEKIIIEPSQALILFPKFDNYRVQSDTVFELNYTSRPPKIYFLPDDKSEFLTNLLPGESFYRVVELPQGIHKLEITGYGKEESTLSILLDDESISQSTIRPFQWNSYVFDVATNDGKHLLRINNDSENSSIYIHGIEIVPAIILEESQFFQAAKDHDRIVYSESSPQENPSNLKKKLQIGGNTVNSVFAPPPSEFSFDADIPQNAILEFGYGLLDEAWENTPFLGDGVDFSIFLERKSDRKILFQEHFDPNDPESSSGIHNRKIDLTSYGGKNVTLRFKTESFPKNHTYSNRRHDLAFWSNPVIYQDKLSTESNVILISLDTLRADHLGCYGYPKNTSPNIDLLAEEGALFSQTFAQAPGTYPSHWSMMTALFPNNHYYYYHMDHFYNPSLLTLADLLREEGYSTSAFTGGAGVSARNGFAQGFDSYFEYIGLGIEQESLEDLYRKTQNWLQAHKNRKFFLFLHTYEIHDPYIPPEEFRKKISQEKLKWNKAPLQRVFNWPRGRFKPLSEKEKDNLVVLYDGEIRYTDERLIEPLVDYLKNEDLYDQTMIIITSDHGEEFYEHKGWGHSTSLYNEQLSVPLIIKFPHAKYRDQKVSQIVRSVDIVPTIMDILDIKVSGYEFDGESLIPLLSGKEKEDRIFVSEKRFGPMFPDRIAINKANLKLVVNTPYSDIHIAYYHPDPPQPSEVELFDMRNDPREKENLAEKKAQVTRELLKRIDLYRKNSKIKKRKILRPAFDKKLEERLKALGYIH
jgi:arylsulfatase A-like enzyme